MASPVTQARPFRGNSTLILLLSGISASRSQWDELVELIAEFPVDIAYAESVESSSRCGAGNTLVDLAQAVAENLKHGPHRRVILLAHSVGTFPAVEIARTVPELVTGTILVNGGLIGVAKFLDRPAREFVTHPKACIHALHLLTLASLPTPRPIKRAIAASRASSRLVLGNLVSPAALATRDRRVALIENAVHDHVMIALWRNRHHWRRFEATAGSTQGEMTFIAGGLDPIAGESDTRKMASMFRHAKVEVLPGIGHIAILEDAPAIAATVAAML